MKYQHIDSSLKEEFDSSVFHPLQSYEWGKFREKTGIKVIRRGIIKGKNVDKGYQITIHKVPGLKTNIGYLPKGYLPTKDFLEDLKEVGRREGCVYIQIEPNIEKTEAINWSPQRMGLKTSFRPLFPKYTFVLDLTKSEEELLANMHQKTRYNIKVAQKHGVKIVEDDSEEGFEDYLKLVEETTKRQRFYAHTREYQYKLWETLRGNKNGLNAHLFLAKYNNKTLAAWMLFIFKDVLYYPYGASSSENREVMASNLMMWESIKFGKQNNLSSFDMWGSLGPDADKEDSWYGFHKFKEGYNPRPVEFVGDYDLVLSPSLYSIIKVGDKARWAYLRAKKFI